MIEDFKRELQALLKRYPEVDSVKFIAKTEIEVHQVMDVKQSGTYIPIFGTKDVANATALAAEATAAVAAAMQ